MVELITGKLLWAPESDGSQSENFAGDKKAAIISTSELCSLEYRVAHYTRDACGRAFGPVGLDQTLQFCQELHSRLNSYESIVLCTPPGDAETRTNSAVLVGAYLLLKAAGWTTEKVGRSMSQDASLKFACSWARKDREEQPRVLSVKHCWTGLEVARRQGWIDPAWIEDQNAISKQNASYRARADVYDASWLVPNRILICADPVTTASDPNPATFNSMFPELPKVGENTVVSGAHMGTGYSIEVDKVPTDCISNPGMPELQPEPSIADSCDSVEKDYTKNFELNTSIRTNGTIGDKPLDFVSFLRQCGVKMLVRTNFIREPGLAKSYDGPVFKQYGVNQIDMPIVDERGGLPPAKHVAQIVEAGEEQLNNGHAVAVHCKGGFGRSVILASCLAVHHLDIPGDALLGWIRIARPGAVNTMSQEEFLCKLKGRETIVSKQATRPWRSENFEPEGHSNVNCCALQ